MTLLVLHALSAVQRGEMLASIWVNPPGFRTRGRP